MKNNLILLISLIFFSQSYAQVPQGFSYQAIYRDAQGNAIGNQNVNVVLSILDSFSNGTTVYSETHNTRTNEFGLVVLSVGTGTPIIGNFTQVDWSKSDKFLKVEFDGNLTSTTQLLSVPYAMVAGNGSSWKDTILKSKSGQEFNILKSKDNAVVSFEPYKSATSIGYGSISMWSTFPYLDFKNQPEDDNHMRIAYDSSGSVGRIGISTLKNSNQWAWDQFVFTEEGKIGIGTAKPMNELHAIGDLRASSINNSSYVLVGGNDGAIILQRQNDGPYIDFTKDRADPTGLAFRMQSINGGLSLITTSGVNLTERARILANGNFGIGTSIPKSKFQVTDGDVYIESVNKGVIMKSPNGQCWRMTVSNTGQPVFNSITCP
jgi:hypothetical protein